MRKRKKDVTHQEALWPTADQAAVVFAVLVLGEGRPEASPGATGGSRVTRRSCRLMGSMSWVAVHREDHRRPPPGLPHRSQFCLLCHEYNFTRNIRLMSQAILEGDVAKN